MRRLLLALLLFSFSYTSEAQFADYSQSFVEHLISRKLYNEAILILQSKKQKSNDPLMYDTANYWIGKTYYYIQQLDSSIYYMDCVSVASPGFREEALLFSSFSESYSGRYQQSLDKVSKISSSKPEVNKLVQFEQAANYLLLNQFDKYDSVLASADAGWRITQQQWINMGVYKKDLMNARDKSPWVGGVLSAIVPGAGKIYAGRKGNGIYTFLISGLMAAQSIEAYRKDGPRSARFIIYSSLFTSFYIGNIWGSALAVKVVKTEKSDAIRQQILFDMHIPLRTFYK